MTVKRSTHKGKPETSAAASKSTSADAVADIGGERPGNSEGTVAVAEEAAAALGGGGDAVGEALPDDECGDSVGGSGVV